MKRRMYRATEYNIACYVDMPRSLTHYYNSQTHYRTYQWQSLKSITVRINFLIRNFKNTF